MTTRNKFSPEVRERAVRMVGEHRADYSSERAAMTSIAAKIGCTAETLRRLRQQNLNFGSKFAYLRSWDRARHYPEEKITTWGLGMARMNLQKIGVFDQDEQVAAAIRLLCEAQAILDKSNYDVAAAHIQMAIDHCKNPPEAPDVA